MKNSCGGLPFCTVFLLISTALSFTSCRKSLEADTTHKSQIKDSLVISSFPVLDQYIYDEEFLPIASMNWVPLQETENSFHSQIDKMIIFEKSIIIFNQKEMKLMNFDLLTGDYKFSYGQIGKGPFEYSRIVDFDVSYKHGKVYVYDDGSNMINVFSVRGEGIRTIPVPAKFKFRKVMIEGNRLIGITSAGGQFLKDEVVILEMDTFKFIHSGIKNKYLRPELNNIFSSNHDVKLHRCNDGIYITEYLNDTVYTIENDAIYPAMIVDFGTLKPDKKYLFDKTALPDQIGKTTLGIEKFIKIDDYLMVSYYKFMPYPMVMKYTAVLNKGNGLNYQFAGAFHPGDYVVKPIQYGFGSTFVAEMSNLHAEFEVMKSNCYRPEATCSSQDSLFIDKVDEYLNNNPQYFNPSILVYTLKN